MKKTDSMNEYWVEAFKWTLLDSICLAGDLPTPETDWVLNEKRRIHGIYQSLKLDSSPLNAKMNSIRYKRIGIYFEYLLRHWIEEDPTLSLLAHDLQINVQKRTIGAIDFLVRAQDGIVEHWEAAFKFYLQDNGVYIGPNRNDSLDAKRHKLRHHQLALTDKSECHDELTNKHLPVPSRKRAFFRGLLFHRWNEVETCENQPFWCHYDDWNNVLKSLVKHPALYPLPKAEWLYPADLDLGNKDILTGPMVSDKPIQYSLVCLKNGRLIETNRFFCVPNGWSDLPFQQR